MFSHFLKRTPKASHYFMHSSDCNRRGRLRSKRGRRSTRLLKLHRLHFNSASDVRNLCIDGIDVVSTPAHVHVNDAASIVRQVIFYGAAS
jgi:hypothetical protein